MTSRADTGVAQKHMQGPHEGMVTGKEITGHIGGAQGVNDEVLGGEGSRRQRRAQAQVSLQRRVLRLFVAHQGSSFYVQKAFVQRLFLAVEGAR